MVWVWVWVCPRLEFEPTEVYVASFEKCLVRQERDLKKAALHCLHDDGRVVAQSLALIVGRVDSAWAVGPGFIRGVAELRRDGVL